MRRLIVKLHGSLNVGLSCCISKVVVVVAENELPTTSEQGPKAGSNK
jgi:hypothetical protein